jgi:5-carboxymethyl-2-hydroxymuconate isomerase
MPHLVLEYSDNIVESDFMTLFQSCHKVLVQQLPTQLESCKSRALKHTTYYIGDGKPQKAFVILKTHFASSLKKTDCQITLEISEIGNFYFKS